MKQEFYLPKPSDIACQASDNKQGRQNEAVSKSRAKKVLSTLKSDYEKSYRDYEKLMEENIARELARINLPLSLYTQWYWQIDLHNLLHFLKLRLDSHAQREIRVYGEVMYKIARKVCPAACDAFEEHVLDAEHFSRTELKELKEMLKGKPCALQGRAYETFARKLGLNPLPKKEK
jgi:thymidylate synthase (FAD)